jgi:pentatricopeptide repeat protein
LAKKAEGLTGRGGDHPERAARAAGVSRPRKLGGAGLDDGAWGPPAGDDERLRAALRALRQDANPTVTSFAVAMDICNKRNFADTALEIFDLMLEKGLAHSQHTIDRRTSVSFFKLVVHSLSDERMRQDGLRLLDAIRAHGLAPAVGAQDHLIVAWRSKLPEHVVQYFVKMREEGIILSWTAYRCIMSAYQWSDPGFTLTLYGELTERGVRPDRVHFNAALTAYCEVGQMDKALQLLKDGPSLRVEPNAQTYQIVVRSCTSNGKFEEALSLFDTMREAQICPYRATHHDVVLCCVKLKRYEDAVALCNGMTPGSQRPNEEAISFLRRTCQKHDWADIAAHLAEDLHQARKRPPRA